MTGPRAHATPLTIQERRHHLRGDHRPRHTHMTWRPCIKTACGYESIIRPCGGRRAIEKAKST